jgi:phytoene dehydrogenase-like protein
MTPVSRRDFLLTLAVAPALVGLTRKGAPDIAGGFVEDDSTVGHALRDGRPLPRARVVQQRRVPVVIVGGGMGGLSAGWRLDALGMRDWTLLELAGEPGGNARAGANDTGKFPWGAHYVPVPGPDATYVHQLFRELKLVDANGEWDERTLCHTPQERLFQHGRWHEGLEPFDALTATDRAQFAQFEDLISEWRATGAFRVPTAQGFDRLRSGGVSPALRTRIRALDTMTADAYLQRHRLTSPALKWWVEYGTRDDFGASLSQASAWAAVHYFAARDIVEQGPLTWPEGNNWIVQQLAARAGNRVVTNAPAMSVEPVGSKWQVRTPQADITADVVIWAAPLFVLPRVMRTVKVPVTTDYAPWVVANITLREPPAEHGAPPAWDNVIYGSPSLGYVDAGHQSLATRGPRRVWTWYHAVVQGTGAQGRQWMQQQSWASWRDYIIADLSKAHANIASCIERIDIKRWGHAMARPVPGVLSRVEQLQHWSPASGIYVAHADLSDLSLFEEAQWHGVSAANHAARRLGAQ